MPAHPARAAPPSPNENPIAPHQLWQHLSSGQQQHVRQVLIGVAKHLVTHQPSPSPHEEITHDCQSQSESSETDARTS
jgi:hypothetical protein